MDAAEELDKLFRAENRLLVGWLARMSGDRQQAEDIAQQTFLELWAKRDTVILWCGNLLYKTAYFRWIDSTRRRTAELCPLTEIRHLTDRQPSPDTQAEWQDLIDRCMARLTDEQQVLVRLKGEGCRTREIAALLDIHESAVKRRYARAVGRNAGMSA